MPDDQPTDLLAGHADADHNRTHTLAPSELLPTLSGTLVSSATAAFTITDTWLSRWRTLALTDEERGTLLSAMAGTQTERRHPALRQVPLDDHGTVAVPCGSDLSTVYRMDGTTTTWLTLRQT